MLEGKNLTTISKAATCQVEFLDNLKMPPDTAFNAVPGGFVVSENIFHSRLRLLKNLILADINVKIANIRR